MQLTKEQSKQFEEFISKLPISKVRSDIERLWDAVIHAGYTIKTEQLDTLNDYAIHLPAELQTFPQTFAHWAKNEDHTKKDEQAQNTPKKEQANLAEGVKSTHEDSKVVDKDIHDNTVSAFDDIENKDAPKETKVKKSERAELTKEAKAGDLHRTIKGMSNDTPINKGLASKEDKKVVLVPAKKAAKITSAKTSKTVSKKKK